MQFCKNIKINILSISDIVNIISRLTKQCTLRLTPNVLSFSVGDDRVSMVWAELSQIHFFSEYVMNGITEEQNEIYLELDATMLARSLGSLRMTAKSVKIKLTNKRQPCLTLEIELPSLSIESRQCLHDVPVRVIPRREWAEHQAPNIPEFDVRTTFTQPDDSNTRRTSRAGLLQSHILTIVAERLWAFPAPLHALNERIYASIVS